VRRWLKRYLAEGVEGLRDEAHPGAPRKVTQEYRKKLVHAVRHRPRSLGLPFSLWTLQRLADHMAEQTGIRLTSYESVRAHLKTAGIVLSRPQHTISRAPTLSRRSKNGGRRDPRRRPRAGRPFLLGRRRVQPELDAHAQGHMGTESSTSDDPHARPTQKALRNRSGGLPHRRDGRTAPPSQTQARDGRAARSVVGEAPDWESLGGLGQFQHPRR
jgi:transposase